MTGSMFSISFGRGQACINGHQFGVEESSDSIGFVYQFGVKGMRARKHVQYQFRVRSGMYKWAPVCGGSYLHRRCVPVWGEGNACQEACSVSVPGGGQ